MVDPDPVEPMPLRGRVQRHRTALIAIAVVGALGSAAWRFVGPAWSDLEYLPILVLAGAGAWLGSVVRAGRAARAWRLISAAWLVSALAVVLWFVGRTTPAVAQVGAVLWNAYYVFMVAGLVTMSPPLPTADARWRAGLEALTVATACGLLVYYFIVRNHADTWTLVSNGIGEPAVLVAAAVLLSRDRTETAERQLGASALLATLADLGHAAARSGVALATWSDVALCVSALFLASAGLRPPGGRQPLRRPVEIGLRGIGHLPSLSAAAVLGVLVVEADGSARDVQVLAIGAGAVVVLLLVNLAVARYAAAVEEDARAAQAERLAAAQRYALIGPVAGAAVHDLIHMICVVDGITDELRALEPVPVGVADLEEASRRAARVCRELLALGARGCAQVTDLSGAAQGLESLLRRVVPRELGFELITDGPLPVLVERGQVEMALVNLVTNARDATRTDGVTVTAERCQVAAGDRFGRRGVGAGAWARLAVLDTGDGMPAEVADRAFQPFFSTKGDRGTGLGLAQVAELAAAAGGHAVVDTAPGRGTEVSVLLPLA